MIRKQKAQGIVEFAFVLPLFLLLSLGVMYFGFVFSDYLTMSNTVRAVAHDASLQSTTAGYSTVVSNHVSGVKLVSGIFQWNPKADLNVGDNSVSNQYISVTYDSESQNVIVQAKATLSDDDYLGYAMKNLMKLGGNPVSSINITYKMYTTRST